MAIGSGQRTSLWIGGAVVLILLALFAPRFFRAFGEAETPAVQVRDSAGVEIVESTGPSWQGGEGWRVDPDPLLRLGVVDGDPAYQFSGIAGLARLEDGTVVVADEGSQEVRFFDAGGKVVAVVGGGGGGPGEFTGLAGLNMVTYAIRVMSGEKAYAGEHSAGGLA